MFFQNFSGDNKKMKLLKRYDHDFKYWWWQPILIGHAGWTFYVKRI